MVNSGSFLDRTFESATFLPLGPEHRPGAVVFPAVLPEVDERPPGLPGHPKSDDIDRDGTV